MIAHRLFEIGRVFGIHVLDRRIALLLQELLPSGIVRRHDREHALSIDNGLVARQVDGLKERRVVALAFQHLPCVALQPVRRLIVVVVGDVMTRHGK